MSDDPTRFSRRTLLAGGLGSALGGLLALSPRRAQARDAVPCADRCLLVWLQGGASQLDTFDPKPRARTGGGVKAIPTAIRGVSFAEHFPALAERASRLAVLRSLTSKEGDHARATYWVRTGFTPSNTIRHPTWGSVVAAELGGQSALPGFVRLGARRPDPIGPGYLGATHAAFQPGVALAPSGGLDAKRRAARRALLERFERPFTRRAGLDAAPGPTSARSAAFQSAEATLSGPLRACLELRGEGAATRSRYGQPGQPFLQARRLLEAGVRCVEVVSEGWDDHQALTDRLPARARGLDRALAALLDDLAERDLLRRTLVLCMGEFGRTPDLNARGGRDHYPQAFSALLAGGGLRVGQALGETDPEGRRVVAKPTRVPDLLATIALRLGADPTARRYAGERPLSLVDGGKPIGALLPG